MRVILLALVALAATVSAHGHGGMGFRQQGFGLSQGQFFGQGQSSKGAQGLQAGWALQQQQQEGGESSKGSQGQGMMFQQQQSSKGSPNLQSSTDETTLPAQYKDEVRVRYVDQNIVQQRVVHQPIIRTRRVEVPVLRTHIVHQPVIRRVREQVIMRPHVQVQTQVVPEYQERVQYVPRVEERTVVQQDYSKEMQAPTVSQSSKGQPMMQQQQMWRGQAK